MTLSQSNLIYRLDKSLASQLLTLGQGNVVYSSGMDVTVTLNGIGMGLSQSNLSYALAKSITGNLISANQGNVTFTNSLSLTGLGLSTSQGALAYGLNKTLDSQLLQLSQGALTASVSGDVNVTLTGIGMGLSQGGLTYLASGGEQQTGGGAGLYAPRRKAKPVKEYLPEPQDLNERDAEIRELILLSLQSKKTAKSIRAERKLRLPVLEIASEIEKTQNKLQQITSPAITSQQMEMMLALMMEMM